MKTTTPAARGRVAEWGAGLAGRSLLEEDRKGGKVACVKVWHWTC